MKYYNLSRIKRIYFGYEEIARVLGVEPESAKVSANRYVKQGLLIRFKRNVYVLGERWRALSIEEKFALANVGQVPSYVSLMTALSYYGITTQVQREFIESAAVKRTKGIKAAGAVFNYAKINKNLFFGFGRSRGFFIASAEKAFLDAVYLSALGRYRFDITSIDFGKLDMKEMRKMLKSFPEKVERILKQGGYLKQA